MWVLWIQIHIHLVSLGESLFNFISVISHRFERRCQIIRVCIEAQNVVRWGVHVSIICKSGLNWSVAHGVVIRNQTVFSKITKVLSWYTLLVCVLWENRLLAIKFRSLLVETRCWLLNDFYITYRFITHEVVVLTLAIIQHVFHENWVVLQVHFLN